MSAAPSPLLAACMIARDESVRISECVAGLVALADEVIVYDTGSCDDTVRLARAAGATVLQGSWHDNFAQARNAALAACSATWILSIDADELVVADRSALRGALASMARGVDAFAIGIEQIGADEAGGDSIHVAKLFRRRSCTWVGWVHETIVDARGHDVLCAAMPASILRLEHNGYAHAAVAADKGRRNARIGLAELQSLNAGTDADPGELGRVLLDLGRSLTACGQRQDAADVLSAVRALPLAPGERCWRQATDLLARLALAGDRFSEALELAGQLGEAGVRRDYCDWISAQALAQLGEFDRAAGLLSPVAEVIDTAGRRQNPAELRELKALMLQLTESVPR